MKISVIIPAYKNKEMLLGNLRKNYPYLKDCEIVIIDDGSGENIAKSISDEFKKIKVVTNKTNKGFGESVNIGVSESRGDYLFLLNNDVVLKDDSYKRAVAFLEKNKDYFAVSCMQKEKDNKLVGKNAFFTRRGFIFNKKARDLNEGINGWAEGGSAVINRKYFEQLSGFDILFSPAYYEDIDLSYRAYKRGLKVFFDPNICVEHQHESTTAKYFSNSYKKTLSYRNHFFFMWKNITDSQLFLKHILFLPYYFVKHGLRLDGAFFRGFLKATFRLPYVIKANIVEKKQTKISDINVLKIFDQ